MPDICPHCKQEIEPPAPQLLVRVNGVEYLPAEWSSTKFRYFYNRDTKSKTHYAPVIPVLIVSAKK